MNPSDGPDGRDDEQRAWEGDDLERASENVLGSWPSAQLEDPPEDPGRATTFDGDDVEPHEPGAVAPSEPAPDAVDTPAADGEEGQADEPPAAEPDDVSTPPASSWCRPATRSSRARRRERVVRSALPQLLAVPQGDQGEVTRPVIL